MNRQSLALSGLAILLVVLHHCIDLQVQWFQQMNLHWAAGVESLFLAILHRLGKVAVPLFLFISGSFLAYAAHGNPPRLSRQTIQSVLLRLLWPYLTWSILFYALVYWQSGENYTLPGYIKNLIVGYPFHFVPLLLFFYLISPMLAFFAKRYGFALILVFALAQCMLILLDHPRMFGVTLPSWASQLRVPILGTTLAMWGLYFPLGLVFALNIRHYQPILVRWRWPLVALTILFYVLDVLHTQSFIRAPLAVHIYPLTFVLLASQIKREMLPWPHKLEYVGKRSYGLYFTHLLVIDLLIAAVQHWAPAWFEGSRLLLTLLFFVAAVGIPLLAMHRLSAAPSRVAYRYVFG